MLKARVHKNTVLFSFEEEHRGDFNIAPRLRKELLNYLRLPYTNLLIDFRNFRAFNEETLHVLEVGQRLSEINHCQVTLFNVGYDALQLMRNKNADHHFFFGDRPKPFSEKLLLV